MKKIICLYGGPCSGKSTTALGLCYSFKQSGFEAELNLEYVKNWVYEDRPVKTGDQTYFFAKQSRKERSFILKEIDFIVTDSPLILTHYYGTKYDWLEQNFNTSKVMLEHHHGFCKEHGYKVEHFFMRRVKPYSPVGRYQTEAEASICDAEIQSMLDEFGIKYTVVDGDEDAVEKILDVLRLGGMK